MKVVRFQIVRTIKIFCSRTYFSISTWIWLVRCHWLLKRHFSKGTIWNQGQTIQSKDRHSGHNNCLLKNCLATIIQKKFDNWYQCLHSAFRWLETHASIFYLSWYPPVAKSKQSSIQECSLWNSADLFRDLWSYNN